VPTREEEAEALRRTLSLVLGAGIAAASGGAAER
jgi:hypothetical protein